MTEEWVVRQLAGRVGLTGGWAGGWAVAREGDEAGRSAPKIKQTNDSAKKKKRRKKE